MSSAWRPEGETDRHEPDTGARRPSSAFVARIALVLVLVVAFVLLFKRSARLEPKLQAVLDAEEAALRAGNWQEFSAHLDPEHAPFRKHQRIQFDSLMSARRQGVPFYGLPYPMRIVEVGRRDNRAWAKVTAETLDGSTVTRVEFFRQVYGAWLHTGPDPNWWGPERDLSTGHVVWRYRETDEEWIAAAASYIESAHARACDDFGLDPRKSVVALEICYSLACDGIPFYSSSPTIDIPTPLLTGWPEAAAREVLPGVVVGHLLATAARTRSDPNVSVPTNPVLMDGIRLWETAQLTGEPLDESPLVALRTAAASGQLLSIDQMGALWASDSDAPEVLRYAQSYALVDYLVASQGPGVLPALARASSPSISLRRALNEVLGEELDLAVFEDDWLSWMRDRYGQ